MNDFAIDTGLFLMLISSVFFFLQKVMNLFSKTFIYVNTKVIVYKKNIKCKSNSSCSDSNDSSVTVQQKSESIFYISIKEVLSSRQRSMDEQKQEKFIRLSNQTEYECFQRIIWSCSISIIVCIIIPILLLQEDDIMQQFFFSTNQQNVELLYKNNMPVRIRLGQLISNIMLMSMIFIQTQYGIRQAHKDWIGFVRIIIFTIIIGLNPLFISLYVLNIVTNLKQLSDGSYFLKLVKFTPLVMTFMIVYYCYPSQNMSIVTEYYSTLLFPSTFQPQSNLMWIFYTHMFNRYLIMYQIIVFLLPISASIPLAFLKINYHTQVLVQYFIVIFTSYRSSYFNVYAFWVICVLCLPDFSSYKKETLIKINKTLGFVAFIGSTFFFFSYKRLTQTYLNSWMVNIGYPFVFGCIAWALIVIWLAELIKIQLDEVAGIPYEQNDTSNKSIVEEIRERILGQIKFKLWTKQGQLDTKDESSPSQQQHSKSQ